ncbi:spore germination protein GerPC [Calidifontibacillus oryziterrae]|uniref:spore germination protein GerPC n=1 Tax=Calidifontibacillus oryziterrae TaxID=1191699 RepID=UPI0002E61A17|nr:spore germination protein GerPC [Calidifontibacillus oryziterrae]
MYGTNGFYYYLNQFGAHVRDQQAQLKNLKKETKDLRMQILSLQKQINEVNEKPTTTIEKIEYKFDQLKIETLEGTLNIGLAPNGMTDPETFENFAIDQPSPSIMPILQNHPELYPAIRNDLDQFMKEQCPSIIDELADKHQLRLDGSQQTFIIQDIERQLDGRIKHYLSKFIHQEKRMDYLEELKIQVVGAVQKDIEKAIEAFINHLPKGGHFSP